MTPCVLLGKPYVWGSIYRFDGQASVFWAEHGPCYRCLYPEPPPPGMVPSCAEGGVLGVLCASIGSIQVTEAIKLLTGIGEPLVGSGSWSTTPWRCRTARSRCARIPTARSAARTRPSPGSSTTTTSAARCRTRPRTRGGGSTITVNELSDWLKAEKPIHLVDVREPAEFEIVKIPGSVLVPKGEILSGQALRRPAAGPPDRPLLQDGCAQCRGARGGQGGGLQGRRACPRWSVGVGAPDRPVAARVLVAGASGRRCGSGRCGSGRSARVDP